MRPSHLIPLACAALLHALPASATVYLPADFDEMISASVFIVHGSVVEVRSEALADRRTIVTYVTVDVEQPLKGSPGEAVTFLVPGGQVGRYERIVVGAPRFERGDEVVVFLSARGPSIPYVFGMSQGIYRISRSSGQPLVLPAVVGADGGAGRIVRGDPARRPLPLDQFAREVRVRMGGAAMERRR